LIAAVEYYYDDSFIEQMHREIVGYADATEDICATHTNNSLPHCNTGYDTGFNANANSPDFKYGFKEGKVAAAGSDFSDRISTGNMDEDNPLTLQENECVSWL
jgi:hypothetical protein